MAERRHLMGGVAVVLLVLLASIAHASDVRAPAPEPGAPAPIVAPAPAEAPGAPITSTGPNGVIVMPVPPAPSAAEVDQNAHELGNPLNKPVTGAAENPHVVGGERPPSLETLQAARPGGLSIPGAPPLEPGREEALRDPG